MKTFLITRTLVLSGVLLAACQSTKNPPVGTTKEMCGGVNALIAQEISAKYDLTTARSIALKLNAAAAADVAYLKALKEGKVDMGAEAKLGTEIKAVIETKTAVTTDYFQQDDTFAKTICWYNAELGDKNLTEEMRDFWNARKKEVALNRTEYLAVLTGLKKK